MKVFIAIVAVAAFVCVNALPSEQTAKVEEEKKKVELPSPKEVAEKISGKVGEIAENAEDLKSKIEDARKKSEEHVKVCVNETGLDAEIAKKITFGDFSFRDDKAKCFVKCFFKRTGFMNEAGEPQKDVIIEKLKNKAGSKYEKLEELIEKCVKETAENECDLAFKIFECYWTNRVVKTIEAAKTA